jgi:hypothetical protein
LLRPADVLGLGGLAPAVQEENDRAAISRKIDSVAWAEGQVDLPDAAADGLVISEGETGRRSVISF